MDIIEPMYIHLATGSEVVSDPICTAPIVFCDIGGHAITQYVTCYTVKDLSYDLFLGVDWLKATNPVIDWVACSLELTVGANLHTVIALLVNIIANVALSSLK